MSSRNLAPSTALSVQDKEDNHRSYYVPWIKLSYNQWLLILNDFVIYKLNKDLNNVKHIFDGYFNLALFAMLPKIVKISNCANTESNSVP